MSTQPPLPTPLPIDALLPELAATLATHRRVVIEAPPGAGKTTRVPLALLGDAAAGNRIIMLEPRRVAARHAAHFMAQQLGEAVGQTVGYRIRHEQRVSPATRIEVVTEAILTRMIQDSLSLDGVGIVIFDEFHERHLHSDLALALTLDLQTQLRDDLRVVVMSATLDGERLSRFLNAPRLRAEGRSHSVETTYLAPHAQETPALHARRAIVRAWQENEGDILVFLPGKREIQQVQKTLAAGSFAETAPERGPAAGQRAEVCVLHGELSLAAQSAVLAPPPAGTRRIVLATNVAESSVTLPAVRAVVDCGLAREPRYDPNSGFSRLVTVRVSAASATQRAGRAGRVAPGRCYRLWPASQRLDPQTRPELMHADLTALALEWAAWGNPDLPWLDAPPAAALAEARERLRDLEALDAQDRITAHGRHLLTLGLHPRLAHALVRQPSALACDLVALLEARDILRGPEQASDDWLLRWRMLQEHRQGRRAVADRALLEQVVQSAARLRRQLGAHAAPHEEPHDAIGAVLALAFPDRIAKQEAPGSRRYQLTNGRGAVLQEDSSLLGCPWIAISDLDAQGADARIRRGAPVSEAFLREVDARRFRRAVHTRFNKDTGTVETIEAEWYGQLLLAERRVPAPAAQDTTPALLQGIAQLGLSALPWTESLRQWQVRASCLRLWMPELNLPDLDDAWLHEHLEDWLGPYLVGKNKIQQINPETLAQALHALLSTQQSRSLETQAPTHLPVPSGNSKSLCYATGQNPSLAVKLQELFGLADTPRVAGGRIGVTLHLLSPAQRPIQVTQDLRSFWERTYPEVKKELKGRYPRHPWPDDPWSAQPTHRAKPRPARR